MMSNQVNLEQGFKQLLSPYGFPEISQLSRSCFIYFSAPRGTLTYNLDKLHLYMNHNILYRFQGQKGGWNIFSKCFCLSALFLRCLIASLFIFLAGKWDGDWYKQSALELVPRFADMHGILCAMGPLVWRKWKHFYNIQLLFPSHSF